MNGTHCVSAGSMWILVLLRKEMEIEYLYAQNDKWVNEKLTLNSAPMKLENELEKLVLHGKEMKVPTDLYKELHICLSVTN